MIRFGTSNANDFAKLYAVKIEDHDWTYEREGIGNSMVELVHAKLRNHRNYEDDQGIFTSIEPFVFNGGQYDREAVEDALVLAWRMSGWGAIDFLEALVDDLNCETDTQCANLLSGALAAQSAVATRTSILERLN